jgi:hypothetical protein
VSETSRLTPRFPAYAIKYIEISFLENENLGEERKWDREEQ